MYLHLKFMLLLCVTLAACTYAQNLEYHKIFGKDTTAITVTITQNSDDYNYRIETAAVNATITEDAIIGRDGLTRKWSYINTAEKLSVQSRLSNGAISLEANNKGKELTKTLKPSHPWRQLFPHDLSTFALGSKDTITFVSIGLFGPGAMSLGTMRGVKLGDETIPIGNTGCACLHVRVGLTGILARFWHADYWLRKSDGRFVRGIWVEKPGSQPSIIQLVQDR